MSVGDFILSFVLAAVPGVLIALVAQQLAIRYDQQVEARSIRNGCKLLALEIASNRSALASFWQEINDLDQDKTEKSVTDHLTAMTEGGFITYPLPHWNFTRWQHAQPIWLSALDEKQVEQVDRFYRDLELIADMHKRMVTLTPHEQEELENDNFWASRYASMLERSFPRFVEVVERALSNKDLF